MLVSVAETNDSRQIRDLLLQMHSETEFYVSPVYMEKLTYHILSTIKNGCVFIVKNKNEIVGSIGGVIGGDWWSEELFLGDLWYYVKPSSRKSTAAKLPAIYPARFAICVAFLALDTLPRASLPLAIALPLAPIFKTALPGIPY